jgi:hypothetical protein
MYSISTTVPDQGWQGAGCSGWCSTLLGAQELAGVEVLLQELSFCSKKKLKT